MARDWRWWVGSVGRVLIASGLLLLAFVAYQLWGTGLQTASAQRSLASEFDRLLAAAPPPAPASPALGVAVPPITPVPPGATDAPASTAPATAPATALPVAPPPEVQEGDALARIEIPRIGVDDIVVAGVQVQDLRKGPGHYPDTPLPGQLGNAAIAGHRTTYGAPFNRVDELSPGDEIVVTTVQGRFVYRVAGITVVAPTDFSVLDPTPDATLTLTSCHPKYSARQRIIVRATLDDTASAPAQPASAPYGSTAATVADDAADGEGAAADDPLVSTVPDGTAGTTGAAGTTMASAADAAGPADPADRPVASADAFDRGWFSDRGAIGPAVLAGIVAAMIYAGGWWVARRHTRWSVVLTAPLFAVALFAFFERFSKLLPPNI